VRQDFPLDQPQPPRRRKEEDPGPLLAFRVGKRQGRSRLRVFIVPPKQSQQFRLIRLPPVPTVHVAKMRGKRGAAIPRRAVKRLILEQEHQPHRVMIEGARKEKMQASLADVTASVTNPRPYASASRRMAKSIEETKGGKRAIPLPSTPPLRRTTYSERKVETSYINSLSDEGGKREFSLQPNRRAPSWQDKGRIRSDRAPHPPSPYSLHRTLSSASKRREKTFFLLFFHPTHSSGRRNVEKENRPCAESRKCGVSRTTQKGAKEQSRPALRASSRPAASAGAGGNEEEEKLNASRLWMPAALLLSTAPIPPSARVRSF